MGQLRFRFKVVGWDFYSNYKRKLCKQAVRILIRRNILICVGTVCLCPTEITLSLYGLDKANNNIELINF